jgi:GDP-4-dehydro-6-deoxy-D-mannose reductase
VKTLVTGSGGFLGMNLVERLLVRGPVTAFSRSVNSVICKSKNVDCVIGDIEDKFALNDCLERNKPDWIIHAAAQSYPSVSWENPQGTFTVNVLGTMNLLEAARKYVPKARILIFSSSSAYEAVSNSKPITEKTPLSGQSPYGCSKAACDRIAQIYATNFDLQVVIARPFFIVGPGKHGDVASDFIKGLLDIESGISDVLKVGNLGAIRDFLPLNDALDACISIIENGVVGEAYNICSGVGMSVRQLLDNLLKHIDKVVQIESTQTKCRPLDEPVRIGCNSKLSGLGWKQKKSIELSLSEMVQCARKIMELNFAKNQLNPIN